MAAPPSITGTEPAAGGPSRAERVAAAGRGPVGWRFGGVLALLFAMQWAMRQTFHGFHLPALVLMTGVFAGCCALLGGWRKPPPVGPAAAGIGLVLALTALGLLVVRESVFFTAGPYRLADRALPLLAVAALATGWLTRRRSTFRLLTAIGCTTFALFLVTQMRRSPTPVIDVWSVTTEAAKALLSGRNPYALTYSDIYERFAWEGYGYDMIFVYLPGLVLHYAPVVAAGFDVRFANLLAQTGGLALCAWFVRPTRPPGGSPTAALAAAGVVGVFWFHGGQVHLLEMAWAEALLLLYLCLAFWAWRRSAWLTGLALVLFLTLKQSAWFCAPFLAALAVRERRWRLMAAVAAGVAVIVGPFFLWNPAAFFHNVVEMLMQMAPRDDAMSWGAACLRFAPALFSRVSALSYLLLGGALVALCLRLRGLSGEDAVLETQKWLVLGLLGFFLFLKVAFFNYYYLVAGLLAFHLCSAAGVAKGLSPVASAEEGGGHESHRA
jgi:hypothetical protein